MRVIILSALIFNFQTNYLSMVTFPEIKNTNKTKTARRRFSPDCITIMARSAVPTVNQNILNSKFICIENYFLTAIRKTMLFLKKIFTLREF